MPATAKINAVELEKLATLVSGSDSVELKMTVPEDARRSAIAGLGLDPLDAQVRQVYFFDTPELALDTAGVVVRARRVQNGQHDTVVKLRPVVPDEVPRHLREQPECKVEVDVIPGAYVCSASLKGAVGPNAIRNAVRGKRSIGSLYTDAQKSFFADHAPEGIELDDLSLLGPIFVLKVKSNPENFSRKMVAELWLYPDGSRILELSTKCLPGEGLAVAAEARKLLADIGVEPDDNQQTKTKAALSFFSTELQQAAAGAAG